MKTSLTPLPSGSTPNGYGGKEICASPPSCPAGTYYPVDKFGLFKGVMTGTNTFNVVPTSTPCIKCGATKSGPTQSVTAGYLYQPDAGAIGQGCMTCPDGKFADDTSCKSEEGADLPTCTSGLAVTGPTRCKDCPSDEVTMQ